MPTPGNIDIQAQHISEGLRTLHDLLEKPVAREALDLTKNSVTSSRHDILRRLRQSLRQYLERDGDLFYVGLLGHFSAGKSSTINSLLSAWDSEHKRDTGLNPTDTTITLITQGKNASSLLGVIREGHVTIRHQPVESPMLEGLVLVDTPGTGDPQFMEEIARDFLPICDVILFLLSAASPLDKSDLPLLSELHKRLQFIPIHFVITRADELRIDFGKPLSEQNIDQTKKAQFIGEVVSRINTLLKPQVYTAEQFILLDNKSNFNVEALRDFLRLKCNSSNAQTRVTMHVNKLQFYLSGAKELRDFFAAFLEAKLAELNKIVAAAARNIKRYQEIVQISNNNLTKAWLDHNAAINDVRTRTVEPLKRLNELPDNYTAFTSASKRQTEVSKDLSREAGFAASSISATVRSDTVSKLQDYFYRVQKNIADTDFVSLTATSHGIKTLKIAFDFNEIDCVPPKLLSRMYNDLRDSRADALRDAASDLRHVANDVDELVQRHAPFAESEVVIQTARESLTKDLNQFFQNVELYRNGVFSHTTKESISTLGIGQKLDALESEFNEDDKSSLTAEALGDLFPEFAELAAKAATRLATLSGKLRVLLESVRLLKTERPEANYQAIEAEASKAKSGFHSDILRRLQSDVDQLCANIGSNVATLLVNAKLEYDSQLRAFRAARKRRYLRIAAITALILAVISLVYYHFNLPAPESTLGAVGLHVISGLIVEALVLLVARWKENVPKLKAETRERSQVELNNKIRLAIESQLRSHEFESLNEAVISGRLNQIYEHIFSVTMDPWHMKAVDFLRTLKALQDEYGSLRADYLLFIDEIHQQCARYFTDASRNLETLNAIAGRIKESAIEPSFALLDQTRQQLEYVKKDIEAVDFT